MLLALDISSSWKLVVFVVVSVVQLADGKCRMDCMADDDEDYKSYIAACRYHSNLNCCNDAADCKWALDTSDTLDKSVVLHGGIHKQLDILVALV